LYLVLVIFQIHVLPQLNGSVKEPNISIYFHGVLFPMFCLLVEDKLYVCVEVSMRTKGVRLDFYH